VARAVPDLPGVTQDERDRPRRREGRSGL